MQTKLFDFTAIMLALGLAILLLWRLCTFFHCEFSLYLPALRKHWRGVLLIVLVLSFLVLDLPYLLDKMVGIGSPEWRFWLQTFAGNWSPDAFPPAQTEITNAAAAARGHGSPQAQPYLFGVSASIAFWLNNAIILVVLTLVWQLARDRGIAVKLTTAFALRDSEIETTVIEAIASMWPDREVSDIRNVVQTSLADAVRHWETTTLDETYGEAQAAQLRARMKELRII